MFIIICFQRRIDVFIKIYLYSFIHSEEEEKRLINIIVSKAIHKFTKILIQSTNRINYTTYILKYLNSYFGYISI